MLKYRRLKKDLSLFQIYALATGATLSSGFFLLPGLAAAKAGPAIMLSYLIAAIHLIPGVFSKAELATAMPRSGGVYYFVDRSLGPLFGTIAGTGTWIALMLKTAFALIGMGAYIRLFLPEAPLVAFAVILAVVFGFINLMGAKKSAGFQVVMVIGLLLILSVFIGQGMFHLKPKHFDGFFDAGFTSIYATAGLVYISYVGLTKIASVAEEVENPERNIPLGMFLALLTAIIIYTVGTTVMVGILPRDQFYAELTPVASAARITMGKSGWILLTIAAIVAFFSVSNAAILSASRYPLAMSRDHLMPRFFRILSKKRTPKNSIYVTVAVIIAVVVFLDPIKIAKLASAFQLLLFALNCLAVIIMRESHIESYDPGYRSPLYPYMHIFGIIAPMFLIVEMGMDSFLFTIGLFVLGIVWYYGYAKKNVKREGAIFHIFERLGQQRFTGLDRELRGIMKEKGLRDEDPFDMVIAQAALIDIQEETTFREVVRQAATKFSENLPISSEKLEESFMEGTRVGATPVSHGTALPHVRLHDLKQPKVVIIRSQKGVDVDIDDDFFGEHVTDEPVHAFFFLVSPEENPGQHLRILAEIAGAADDERFIERWLKAKNEVQMKELLLRDEHFFSLKLHTASSASTLVGQAVRDLSMPPNTLIAIIHRDGEILIPRGETILQRGDRLTIVSDPAGIEELEKKYQRH